MTPKRAISITCRVCNGGKPCHDTKCALNNTALSHILRIKAHCQECATDNTVSECTGKIIGAQAKMQRELGAESDICPLFPFRYGKNPRRSRKLSEEEKKAFSVRTAGYRFRKKEPLCPPES